MTVYSRDARLQEALGVFEEIEVLSVSFKETLNLMKRMILTDSNSARCHMETLFNIVVKLGRAVGRFNLNGPDFDVDKDLRLCLLKGMFNPSVDEDGLDCLERTILTSFDSLKRDVVDSHRMYETRATRNARRNYARGEAKASGLRSSISNGRHTNHHHRLDDKDSLKIRYNGDLGR